MIDPKKHTKNLFEFSPTNSRFNLENRIITEDRIEHSLISPIRFVAYNYESRTLPYRERFITEGLLLGKFSHRDGGKDIFTVPMTARSLSLEAHNTGEGSFTYSDRDMIKDVGWLSGATYRLSGKIITEHDAAEKAFALVDYAPIGKRPLFILPGTEQLLRDAPQGNPLQDQMAAFSKEFGVRFSDFSDSFIEGYGLGLEGVQ